MDAKMRSIFVYIMTIAVILTACQVGAPPTASANLQATNASLTTALATALTPASTATPDLQSTIVALEEKLAAPQQPAAAQPPAADNGYTNIHPLDENACQPLSAGQPMVWKDYVRDQKLVRIYAHDGKGELGSKICREVNSWGWRVPWDGMETYEDAIKYASEEASRVLAVADANPAFPRGDVVVRIEIYHLNQLVQTILVPAPVPTQQ